MCPQCGDTPLHVALHYKDTVTLLVASKADVNAVNKVRKGSRARVREGETEMGRHKGV
jgi:hypothetical protein